MERVDRQQFAPDPYGFGQHSDEVGKGSAITIEEAIAFQVDVDAVQPVLFHLGDQRVDETPALVRERAPRQWPIPDLGRFRIVVDGQQHRDAPCMRPIAHARNCIGTHRRAAAIDRRQHHATAIRARVPELQADAGQALANGGIGIQRRHRGIDAIGRNPTHHRRRGPRFDGMCARSHTAGKHDDRKNSPQHAQACRLPMRHGFTPQTEVRGWYTRAPPKWQFRGRPR